MTTFNARALSFVLLVCLVAAQQAGAQNAPQANPARPTVATPATLTPVGYVQFETGAQHAWDSPGLSNQLSASEVVKLAVHSRLQMIAQYQPFLTTVVAGARETNDGETFGGLQGVIVPGGDRRPTISINYFHRLHESVAPDLDVGSSLQNATLLFSTDAHGFHFDIDAMITEQVEDAVRRAQFGQALSVSHQLRKFTVAGELWHFTQPFAKADAVGNLWAISYTVRSNLVIDVGFNHGLTPKSTRWTTFGGFTYLLPHRLW